MCKARRIGLPLVPVLLSVLIVVAPSRSAAIPRIIFEIPDFSASSGQTASWLTLHFTNYFDTVAGIQFQLRVDRPDLVWFDLSGPDYDSAGTLLSGWEFLSGKDTTSNHSVYTFVALANLPFTGPETPGIPPQTGDMLLRVPFSTNPNPDPDSGLTCTIDLVGTFMFSDPNAQAIGWVVVDTVFDTLFYKCTNWSGDNCLSWIQVDPDSSAWDSIYVFEYYPQAPDSTQIIINNGSITLLPPGQATCDYDANGSHSVTDLVCLVNYLFRTLGTNCTSLVCDCNNSGNDPTDPNVADLTCMVSYLFRGGPPPGR